MKSDIAICRNSIPQNDFFRCHLVLQIGGENPNVIRHGRSPIVYCDDNGAGFYICDSGVLVAYATASTDMAAFAARLLQANSWGIVIAITKWSKEVHEASSFLRDEGKVIVLVGPKHKGWTALSRNKSVRIVIDRDNDSVEVLK